MSEYIEREAAIEAMKALPHEYKTKEQRARTGGIAACQMIVRNVPAADVRPVRRGRWIPFTSEAAGDIWYCSACDVGFAHHMDFCPHCGADMREEAEE